MTQPHSTYLLSLVAGEMDVRKDTWEGKPLYYVVPKGKGDLAKASFGNTPDMLSLLLQNARRQVRLAQYAQSAVFDFPGGMENVSATTLGTFAITDSRMGLWPSSSLTSHELAHQWFGDLVTCKDWGRRLAQREFRHLLRDALRGASARQRVLRQRSGRQYQLL